MRLGQTLSFAAASLIFAGCFAPDGGVDLDTDEAADGSTAGESEGTSAPTTAEPTTGSTSSNPTATTTGNPTTGNPTTGSPTSGSPTTTDPTTDDTTDPTSGGEDPFCGDGNVDPGEECDDGLENNGLDESCLPDCNLNVCGDGNIGPDEFCDDGEGDNVLEVGACAPDCSTVIEEKVIRLSATFGGGNHQPNPVGFADSQCAVGTRALFTVPGVRQATDGTPNEADDQIDWPLRPFTAYVRQDGTPIWTTDETPLLGIRDGVVTDLVNSIWAVCEAEPEICFISGWPVVTGMDQDWTPSLSDTCNGWSSDSGDLDSRVGEKTSVDEFLESGEIACSTATGDFILVGTQPVFYCVEQ